MLSPVYPRVSPCAQALFRTTYSGHAHGVRHPSPSATLSAGIRQPFLCLTLSLPVPSALAARCPRHLLDESVGAARLCPHGDTFLMHLGRLAHMVMHVAQCQTRATRCSQVRSLHDDSPLRSGRIDLCARMSLVTDSGMWHPCPRVSIGELVANGNGTLPWELLLRPFRGMTNDCHWARRSRAVKFLGLP